MTTNKGSWMYLGGGSLSLLVLTPVLPVTVDETESQWKPLELV